MSKPLTAKDFTTDQEVRWCPGCGDYAILKTVRATLAEIGRPPHEVAFVSGIGCAARFPYYMNTYGFHTVHGRAPAVATGLKLANPALDVWVVGGDGDFLSIGGNHLIHALRRDVDLNLLLFNNAIYGLTKGQSSPTSFQGTRSPSTPRGSVEEPCNAIALALGAGARFVARSADTRIDILSQTLKRAHAHKGASLVEILQNCIVYNDNVWGGVGDKASRAEKSILLEHGKPMIFGANQDKGLVWQAESGSFRIEQGAPGEIAEKATIFDETNLALALALARVDTSILPVPLGVLYCAEREECAQQPVGKPALDRQKLQQMLSAGAGWSAGPTDTNRTPAE